MRMRKEGSVWLRKDTQTLKLRAAGESSTSSKGLAYASFFITNCINIHHANATYNRGSDLPRIDRRLAVDGVLRAHALRVQKQNGDNDGE